MERHPTTTDLLRKVGAQNTELRELLSAVAHELERLACVYPEHADVLLARAQRLRFRLWNL